MDYSDLKARVNGLRLHPDGHPQVVIEMGPKLSRSVRVGDSGPMVPPIGVPFEEAVTRLMKVKPTKTKKGG
jgi:hypothetical protein